MFSHVDEYFFRPGDPVKCDQWIAWPGLSPADGELVARNSVCSDAHAAIVLTRGRAYARLGNYNSPPNKKAIVFEEV